MAAGGLLCSLLILVLLQSAPTRAQSTFYTGDTRKCASIPGPVVVPTGAVNLVQNPGFESGVEGWTTIDASTKLNTSRISRSNQNPYVVASIRQLVSSGPAQVIDPALIQNDVPYIFSAWVKVAKVDSQFLQATMTELANGVRINCLGSVIARTGCWTLVSGSITFDSIPVSPQLSFEGPSILADIWVDSVVFYQGDETALRASQDESIETNRKRDVVLSVVESDGKPVPNADVKVEQTSSAFVWGVDVDSSITSDVDYQNYILARKFNQIQFLEELIWNNMQPTEAAPDYTVTDAMVAWAQSNNMTLRGYNIFSEKVSSVPTWVQSKTGVALIDATEARVSSLLTRYKGKFFGWDVDQGIMSGDFYKNNIDIQASFFQKARLFDPKALLFMNERDTSMLCGNGNQVDNTDKYLTTLGRLRKLKAPVTALALSPKFFGTKGSSFDPNPYTIKFNIDKLATSGLPIYVTSLSLSFIDTLQADYLETAMRAYFSDPSVQGISLATTTRYCQNFCITDDFFNPYPASLRYDTLRALWSTNLHRTTNDRGNAFFSGFFGSYKITVTKANGDQAVFTVPLSASRTVARVTLKFKK